MDKWSWIILTCMNGSHRNPRVERIGSASDCEISDVVRVKVPQVVISIESHKAVEMSLREEWS